MEKQYSVRTLILAGGLLLQLNTLCFQSRGAANDDFANAQIISGSSGTTNGGNSNATLEPGEPDHADAPGGKSVWYRWTAPASGNFSFSSAGSDFDTLLAVYTGVSVNALTEVASNDDIRNDLTSGVSIAATAGTTYQVAVDGYDGETGMIALNWASEVPPANDDFADAIVITGATGTVSGSSSGATKEPGEPDHASDSGGRSVWYRWTAPASGMFVFNTVGSDFNTLMAVYTGSSVNDLTEKAGDGSSFSATGGTMYQVAVDGYGGEAGTLVLNWASAAPPVNDNFADATQLIGAAGSTNGSSSNATKESGEPDHAGDPGGKSVWFRWTAPTNGQYSFNTAGSGFYTLLAVYTGASVNSVSLMAGNDGFDGEPMSLVNFPATGGTVYYVAVDGFAGASGGLSLHWAPSIAVAPELPFRTLHSFPNGSDGANPRDELILSGNTLYGTASSGGISDGGTVFAVNIDGTGFRLLHSFTSGSDGGTPYVGLTLSGKTLYGTTWGGGSSDYGTVFAVNTNGTAFTNLHNFTATAGSLGTNSDGANPSGGLMISGGTLYGTTWDGGSAGGGTVFGLGTNGTGFTNLHNFIATSGPSDTNSDGSFPSGSLILSGGTLYGTAGGGGISGYGTVFAVQTNGAGFTTLHSFDWMGDGGNPRAITLSGSTLYGTAIAGGNLGCGTLFAMQINGTGFTNLYDFKGGSGPHNNNLHGSDPVGPLFVAGDILYGVTLGGGSSGKGAVFAINTNGTGITTLHSFSATIGLSATNSDGAYSQAGLILSHQTLYGTAEHGGSSGYGTVFSIPLPPPQLTITPSAGNVLLKWPMNAVGFTVESTTNLAAWSPVAQPAVTNTGQISVTVPLAPGQKFFRLKAQ